MKGRSVDVEKKIAIGWNWPVGFADNGLKFINWLSQISHQWKKNVACIDGFFSSLDCAAEDGMIELFGSEADIIQERRNLLDAFDGRLWSIDCDILAAFGFLDKRCEIAVDSRNIELMSHMGHCLGIDEDLGSIVIIHDFSSGLEFGAGHDAGFREEFDSLVFIEDIGGLDGGLEVEKSALFSFLDPGIGIAIAIEDDSFMIFERCLDPIIDGNKRVLASFDGIGKVLQGLSDNRIQDDIGVGHILVGTDHTEFEAVAREGKWGCSISIGGISRKDRERLGTSLKKGIGSLLGSCIGVDNLFDDSIELIAKEDGNDGRRRFIGTQTEIVGIGCDGFSHQSSIFVNRFDDGSEEDEELRILMGVLSRLEKIDAGVGLQGPVVMFSGTIDACEWLFGK